MKIGFVINDIATEVAAYTTVHLAVAARNLGHDVSMLGVAGFIYDPDGSVHAQAYSPRKKTYGRTNSSSRSCRARTRGRNASLSMHSTY